MMFRSLVLLATLAASTALAAPVSLAPHQAVYELTLLPGSNDFVDAEGRIAMKLRTDSCGVYDLDYRFVAKFQQEEEVTVTDQQTISTENAAGTRFDFTTKTFIDGSPEKEIRGAARQEGDATRVAMQAPVATSFNLPLSRFPLQHTAELIARAKAGDRIVEAKLFDGDDDAKKLLTSTAIISPNEPATAVPPPPPAAPAAAVSAAPPETTGTIAKPVARLPVPRSPEIAKTLAGLQSWKISESYYNSDSDPDGMPVFQTSYVLYENGVSDDLTLDFGDYGFTGALSQLELLKPAACE